MKKVFTPEYPNWELIKEIEEWIDEQCREKNGDGLKVGMYKPTIIIEIITNK